jgi:hypothetical protein
MKTVGNIYLHVGNSGVTFKVQDEGHGPTIAINWGAFGNLNSELRIHTDKAALTRLGNMFLDAALKPYSEEYCHKARDTSRDTWTEDETSEGDNPVEQKGR